jgi:predicted RND superfamily exporter protein
VTDPGGGLWAKARRVVLGPVERPRATLVVTTILVVLALVSITRVRTSGSAADLLGTDKPSVVALQKVLDEFPSADELLVLATLEREPASAEAGVERLISFAAEVDRAIAAHRAAHAETPFGKVTYAASPQFMEFFQKEAVPAGLLYLSDADHAALAERLTLPAMREQLAQNEAMLSAPGPAAGALARTLIQDPLRLRDFLGTRLTQAKGAFRTWRGGPEFVSDDGRSILIRIAGLRSPSDLDFCKRIVSEAERVVATVLHEGITVELSGAYAIAAASERAIRSDLTANVIWSMVLLQVVFLIGFRNVFSFALAFVPNGVALLLAFGVFALISPVLTPLTAAVAATLIACGIDLSVYLISFYEERRKRGMGAHAAAAESVRELTMPLVAASTTTVVGFAAIAFSSIQALRDFAILGSIGLVLSLLATLWLLPALLTKLSREGRPAQVGARVELGGLVNLLDRRASPLIVACCGAMVVSAGVTTWFGWPRFETNLNVMHPQPNRPLETEHEIGRRFGGGETLIVYAEAGTGAELVTAAHRIEAALAPESVRAEAHIAGVMGLASLLPDPARAANHRQLPIDKILADFKEAVQESGFAPAAFAGYEEFLRAFLSPKSGPTLETLDRYPDVRDLVLARGSPPAAITIVSIANTENDAHVRDGATRTLREAVQGIPGAVVTGMAVVGHDVEHAVRIDLPRFMIAATLAVVVLLLLCLRSIKYTLLSLIPLLFGGVCLLAAMGVMGERLNLANTMAVPLLLGIGVDYGIFLAVLAQQAEKQGEGRAQLAERFKASFHAIAHTAITSFIGFGTLVVTSTPAVQSLGRVIAIGVGASLVGAFLLLAPLLLMLAEGSGAGRARHKS